MCPDSFIASFLGCNGFWHQQICTKFMMKNFITKVTIYLNTYCRLSIKISASHALLH
jgi:hypothetical protein